VSDGISAGAGAATAGTGSGIGVAVFAGAGAETFGGADTLCGMFFSGGNSGFSFSGTGGFSGAGGGSRRTEIFCSGWPSIPSRAANHASRPMTTT